MTTTTGAKPRPELRSPNARTASARSSGTYGWRTFALPVLTCEPLPPLGRTGCDWRERRYPNANSRVAGARANLESGTRPEVGPGVSGSVDAGRLGREQVRPHYLRKYRDPAVEGSRKMRSCGRQG